MSETATRRTGEVVRFFFDSIKIEATVNYSADEHLNLSHVYITDLAIELPGALTLEAMFSLKIDPDAFANDLRDAIRDWEKDKRDDDDLCKEGGGDDL